MFAKCSKHCIVPNRQGRKGEKGEVEKGEERKGGREGERQEREEGRKEGRPYHIVLVAFVSHSKCYIAKAFF